MKVVVWSVRIAATPSAGKIAVPDNKFEPTPIEWTLERNCS